MKLLSIVHQHVGEEIMTLVTFHFVVKYSFNIFVDRLDSHL